MYDKPEKVTPRAGLYDLATLQNAWMPVNRGRKKRTCSLLVLTREKERDKL